MKRFAQITLIVLVVFSVVFPAAASPVRDESVQGMFPAIQSNLYPLGIDIRHVSVAPYYTEQPPSSPWTGIQAVVINHSANRYGLPQTGYVTTGCATMYGSAGCTPKRLIVYMVDNQSGQQNGDGSQLAIPPVNDWFTVCQNSFNTWMLTLTGEEREELQATGMISLCFPFLYMTKWAAKGYAWSMFQIFTTMSLHAETPAKALYYRGIALRYQITYASLVAMG